MQFFQVVRIFFLLSFLMASCTGCAVLLLPPIVSIPMNGLQEYGFAVNGSQVEYAELKKSYQENECAAWDRNIKIIIARGHEQKPNASVTELLINACKSQSVDCYPPAPPRELQELVSDWGMPPVVCE